MLLNQLGWGEGMREAGAGQWGEKGEAEVRYDFAVQTQLWDCSGRGFNPQSPELGQCASTWILLPM